MEEIKIQSSIIESISYYGKSLYVKLKDGKLLSYNSVPRELFDEFIKTTSHDDFYMNVVPKFSFQRMV